MRSHVVKRKSSRMYLRFRFSVIVAGKKSNYVERKSIICTAMTSRVNIVVRSGINMGSSVLLGIVPAMNHKKGKRWGGGGYPRHCERRYAECKATDEVGLNNCASTLDMPQSKAPMPNASCMQEADYEATPTSGSAEC